MTPTQRGDLAEYLVALADDLRIDVREYAADDVWRALVAKLDAYEARTGVPRSVQLASLTFVLASLVDGSKPIDELLWWVTWDEHGRPLTARERAGSG